MKKNFSITTKGVFFSSLAVTVISVILRSLSMLFFFDSSIGYYSIGAALPIISNIFTAVGVIGFLILAFAVFRGKELEVEYGKVTPFQIVGAVLGVCASLLLTVSTLPAAFDGDKFAWLCSALAFTGGLYFPCACLRLGTVWKFITGFSLIARITCMMGVYYFDQNITMNAPDKIIFCIASIFGMLIVACEIKALMGVVRPWLFITAAAGASIVCSTSAIPSIIKFHADKEFLGGGYAEYWLLFALSIYALAALCACSVKSPTPQKSEDTILEADAAESTDAESDQ